MAENNQIRINVDYVYDERSQEIIKLNKYGFPSSDSTLIINENDNFNSYNNIADIKLTYTDNSPGHFIENALKLSGKWASETSSITGTNKVQEKL